MKITTNNVRVNRICRKITAMERRMVAVTDRCGGVDPTRLLSGTSVY
jgi:hypothetical protein